MSIFESLFPKSPFSHIQSHMEKVAICVQKVEELFDVFFNNNYEQIEKISSEISKLEHMADLTKNEIRSNLPKGIFLAVNRGDLLEILTLQDTIADKAEDIGILMTLKKLEPLEYIKEDFENFLNKNIEAVQHVHQIIRELDELLQSSFSGKEAEKVRQMVQEVAYIEHEADLILRELLKKFYNMEEPLKYSSFLLWINIVQTIAALGDTSERLANKISMLLEKK